MIYKKLHLQISRKNATYDIERVLSCGMHRRLASDCNIFLPEVRHINCTPWRAEEGVFIYNDQQTPFQSPFLCSSKISKLIAQNTNELEMVFTSKGQYSGNTVLLSLLLQEIGSEILGNTCEKRAVSGIFVVCFCLLFFLTLFPIL